MSESSLPLLTTVDDDTIALAAETLLSGGLVVFPTDTVYGVGAAIDQPDAVGRLYSAKGRPSERPIPVLVSSIAAARVLVTETAPASRALMERFWPGALTIVFPAVDWLPTEIVRDTGMVGLRMPDHPIALAIIERAGGAVAVTSANRSDKPETRIALDAMQAIGHAVDLVLDGGVTPGGVVSTVVRVDGASCTVLRHGAVSEHEISETLASRDGILRPDR